MNDGKPQHESKHAQPSGRKQEDRYHVTKIIPPEPDVEYPYRQPRKLFSVTTSDGREIFSVSADR